MSVSTITIEALVDAGRSGTDILVVAKAGQRGDDHRSIADLVSALRELETPAEGIAIAVMALAHKILEANTSRLSYFHAPLDDPSVRDTNRARRNMPDGEWRSLREIIFKRDDYKCQYCFCIPEYLTCDHIIPLARGGTNDPGNLTTACRSCNSSKGAKLLSEWFPL